MLQCQCHPSPLCKNGLLWLSPLDAGLLYANYAVVTPLTSYFALGAACAGLFVIESAAFYTMRTIGKSAYLCLPLAAALGAKQCTLRLSHLRIDWRDCGSLVWLNG